MIVSIDIMLIYFIGIALTVIIGYICGSKDGYRNGVADTTELVEMIFLNADKIEVKEVDDNEGVGLEA